MHKASYLPLALDDLKGIVRYISEELDAPQAAENLINKIDKGVKKIEENPYRCHVYISSEKMKYEYRVLNVNNYSLFYIAENGKIEIHRIIYSRRDIPRVLNNSPRINNQ